jgi:hypothetical protein
MRCATVQGIVVAVVLAAAAPSASAANWVKLQDGRAGENQYYDSSSVATTGDREFKLWTKTEYDDAQGEIYEEKYKHSKKQLLIRCQNRTAALVQEVNYANKDGSGRITFARVHDYPKFLDPVPETIGETVISEMCPQTPQKPAGSTR